MAFYASQLQPFEEHQSPSPTDELSENPYELALAPRRTSSLHPRRNSSNNGPPSPVNSLHSRLSGDPESPPPAWKRRSSITAGKPAAASRAASESPGHSANPSTSSTATASSIPARIFQPPSRKHPSLAMTTATAPAPVPPRAPTSLNPSPHGSSTSLGDNLALPNPAFIRRRGGDGSASPSARSSISSSQDLNTLTSEELWSLNREDVPDMSNPHTTAAERPLDTVRRQSKMSDAAFHGGLPGEVIWPSAPPVDDFAPLPRAKSHASINTLGKKRMSIRSKSRRTSDTPPINTKPNVKAGAQSMPVSPVVPKQAMMSSAHSSSTSLSSHQALSSNKSFPALNGKGGAAPPPTTYYSRDFLSSLAPREGGYAIAAQLGGGLGAAGTITATDNKRRSSYAEQGGRARAPMAKSTGMGRWSLDGGENYGRPYMTASASTTASNLSAPPLTSNPSNTSSIEAPRMPEGAMPAISTPHGAASVSPAPAQAQRASPNPSPLSQQTSAEDVIPPTPEAPVAPNAPQVTEAAVPATKQESAPVPAPASAAAQVPPAPAVTEKRSKRQIAKDTKAARKAEQQAAAQAAARAKAEQMRVELAKKQKAREDEQKRKEDAKRQEKEEKARKKAEKKDKKNGVLRKTAASEDLKQSPAQVKATPVKAAPAQTVPGTTPSSVVSPAPTATTPARASSAIPSTPTTLRSAANVNTPESGVAESTRPSRFSMPAGRMLSSEQAGASPSSEKRPEVKLSRSFFGTLRKRLSSNVVEKGDREASPVPPMPNGAAQAQAQAQDDFISPPPRRTSLMAVNRGSSSKSQAPASEAVAEESPVDSPSTVRPNVASALANAPSSPSPSPSRSSHQIPRKPVSPEGSINGRRSVSGPRPMPTDTSRSRTTSLAALSTEQGELFAPVTPSTSGDDSQLSYMQSRSSHKSDVTPVTSLSGSEAMSEDGSRDKDIGAPVLGGEVQPAEKQSSKDSDETLLPHQATAVNAPVLA
ncbi:hypothetical protein L202_02116 [Cryptococcus amylolentus CBS 6039]|uniref:Uncharacterized protein n=1 Tax=Cryptococcus amylolentus CBS 6039 TaxID=1295533 RepID=A0A1E3HZE6_9TREE|nr:hypothetical protein L202_02116 [Cryptococcus amylolentus CBS 6039]ODN81722.1 hypothetical protein L202_02116 [Cryptococcus amylolentus CBS 6039]